LVSPADELGTQWEQEANKLYALNQQMMAIDTSSEAQYAEYSANYEAFLAELVTTCCEALAQIAQTGFFAGAQDLDFYVGLTDESGDSVCNRDARIRRMIGERTIP
jgi:hypothetical protein